MNGPAYRQIAADLRKAIERGEYPEGAVLPKITDIAVSHGISKQTAREAIAELEAEGLVEVVRRRGTVVRARPVKRRLTRSRQVFRDELGYYFDPTAQSWRALETPTISWGRPPKDVALMLGGGPDDDVLVRDRVMGDPETGRAMQLATSFLPAAIARGTQLAEGDTGPGGIYDRLEEMGHSPLAWEETVGSRMPTPAEAERLHLAKGVPLLRIVRTTTGPDGTVLEVNDTRMSADEFEVGYPVTRHPSAQHHAGGSAADRHVT
ncbi:GntR family transcriptional regulator [Micromonospora tulbaghiae]|uniref:GntR family transcriptional regulator n=2 Tax=Streptomyces TaxID=1883 RepID=A0A1E7LT29_9ACTN|nr:GntR family transcriptional regulator [Streptomyces nanshensis]OEV19355.1 GntR family transcriptional regulator [Streptomyces nanshensis]